jgi:predicted RNase H-like nuclease (RuvC/YqgF family)
MTLDDNLKAAQTQNVAQKTENDQLQANVENLSGQVITLQAAATSLQQQLEAIKQGKALAETALSNQKAVYQKLVDQVGQLREKNDQLTESIGKLVEINRDLTSRLGGQQTINSLTHTLCLSNRQNEASFIAANNKATPLVPVTGETNSGTNIKTFISSGPLSNLIQQERMDIKVPSYWLWISVLSAIGLVCLWHFLRVRRTSVTIHLTRDQLQEFILWRRQYKQKTNPAHVVSRISEKPL